MRLKVSCTEFPIQQWVETSSLELVDSVNCVADLCHAIWMFNGGCADWRLQILKEGFTVPMTGIISQYLKTDDHIKIVKEIYPPNLPVLPFRVYTTQNTSVESELVEWEDVEMEA
ncbi:hypothetical protein POMI540_1772 [Schizosaccharomyces pombe]|uniref:Uncharacterized protein C18G6.13 n=1 Tax=Schizosaccharomyces pombe (strain 972 / ATCC 24843) TaxID=284812 RepID=YAQD_SCHPO|nr:uncharacterized protein SPAC18G6.13 [Schizosaccharomyces pombe]Q10112.1 RecName: Full=Uncharacterized protein C18G6.13 [Schizosaccharomyces pombe 972h-]CAA92391.1 sequence orphan [Schizosaccharomyces pombe]|eukprot:NP_593676.1 uncharacterized protein SPAC18G6.13 [Schizosaccharomyces pombe]